MPFSQADFARVRPFAYHLTSADNLRRIARTGVETASALMSQASSPASLHAERRSAHVPLQIDGELVWLRDQKPLHEANIGFEDGWTFGDLLDSSKTRVRPVFDALWNQGRDWLPKLLALPGGGCPDANVGAGKLALLEGHWEPNEKCLNPPVSLLSWLVRNTGSLKKTSFEIEARQRLAEGDPAAVTEALRLLPTDSGTRGWYVFEGPTCPGRMFRRIGLGDLLSPHIVGQAISTTSASH